jgi:hypothetical protein
MKNNNAPKKEHESSIVLGLIIFVIGLALALPPISAFGVGMVVSNVLFRKRQTVNSPRSTLKRRMTSKEHDQLVSVILPVVTNNK